MSEACYEVHLSQFEGPLDLLLHLVRRAEIDLKDIFISEITEQYLHFMNQTKDVDEQLACRFLEVASLLLCIKSRALLPMPPDDSADQPEEDDPRVVLLDNLRRYELYRKAAEQLNCIQDNGHRMFGRSHAEIDGDAELSCLHAELRELTEALQNLLERRAQAITLKTMRVKAEPWSISVQKTMILRSLMAAGTPMQFCAFLSPEASTQETAVTFCAMLELWNTNTVRLHQSRSFGAIIVAWPHEMPVSNETG